MPDLVGHGSLGDEWGDAGALLEAISPPAWHALAACRTAAEVDFFTPHRFQQRAALAVCAGCPVLDDCRAWALGHADRLVGVWGGLTARDRRRLAPPAAEVASRPVVEGHPHGSRWTYSRWGCRCPECVEANRDYARELYRRSKAAG